MTQYTSFVAVDTAARAAGTLGQGGENVRGGPGTEAGDTYGVGGLGLVGTGVGGGGTGEGTIGLGTLGTIGHGSGSASGSGYGVGYGRGAGMLARRSVAVSVGAAAVNKAQPGDAEVQGSLDKEIVRRVVRRHLNELRFIYEKARSHKLAGRIVVRFVIGADGRVTEATVTSSTLPGDALQADVLNAIRHWQFPAPQGGGKVIVNYPFAFHP
jgi:TonB family protein